jgi:hypothetical protein
MTSNVECDETATKNKTTTMLGALTGVVATVPN